MYEFVLQGVKRVCMRTKLCCDDVKRVCMRTKSCCNDVKRVCMRTKSCCKAQRVFARVRNRIASLQLYFEP